MAKMPGLRESGALPLLPSQPVLPPAARAHRAAAALRRAIPADLRRALLFFLALRLLFSLYAFMLPGFATLRPPCTAATPLPTLHDTGLDFRLLGVWQRNDACAYERIAVSGYAADGSVAFFPLYPLLMRLLGGLPGGNATLGGLLVSGLAYIAAMVGLQRLTRADFGEEVAARAVLLLSVFPTAFFLFAPYTEALFLALAIWTLHLARSGRWGWAAPLALLVGLTRTQGLLLCLPLAWECYAQWRQRRCPAGVGVVALLPACGFLAYVAYSRWLTGWTIFDAQRVWGMQRHAPWQVVAFSWQQVRERGDFIEALNLALVALFSLVLVLGLRRLPTTYILYCAPQLLLILSLRNGHSPLMSASRFMLVLFPIFILLALFHGRPWTRYPWLAVSGCLLVALTGFFLASAFVA